MNKIGIELIFISVILLCLSGESAAQVRERRPLEANVERSLIERIEKLERRIAELEAKLNSETAASNATVSDSKADIETLPSPLQTDKNDHRPVDFLHNTTFNVTFDGYYGYNFNRPVGGINLLRAYDVTSNSFSLNHAAVIIENTPNLEKGKRYGFRLDLQYGQATETVQGNAANEPRPQAYRNLWQAYGTYVFDVGKGLTATQPGLSTDVIRPVPSGRFHVLDTCQTIAVNDKWTFAVSADYVVGRVFRESAPATGWGGAGYASYQWTPKFALRGRLEYLAEKASAAGRLFSGMTQALKEGTFTGEYKFADGFLLRGEYRRDWSNRPFFLTEQPGVLKNEQNTARLVSSGGSGESKEHGDASSTNEFEANDSNDIEGSEFIQIAVYRPVHRLANTAAQPKRTRGSA